MEIVEITTKHLSELENLWNELNALHYDRSSNFKKHFSTVTFAERCKKLLAMEDLAIYATKVDGKLIAYCIASINNEIGEIDSLYVKSQYHKQGFGKQLVNKAMSWLNNQNCTQINVNVAEGNEVALPFYERLGFKTRYHVLQIKT